jgi:hypothetical protein
MMTLFCSDSVHEKKGLKSSSGSTLLPPVTAFQFVDTKAEPVPPPAPEIRLQVYTFKNIIENVQETSDLLQQYMESLGYS